MADRIFLAYENDHIVLIEAGTGTGKSLAYLVPALTQRERTVISTHTIALQEQLLLKDIPSLVELLETDVSVVLVKGMHNYVCQRKLQEQLSHLPPSEERDQLEGMEQCMERTQKGSYSDFPFKILPSTWQQVSADAEDCTHVHCPHYKECYFFKAKQAAQDAQILIVNHHLLLADLQRRIESGFKESILPDYSRVVLDEAHHFEKIALETFSASWDRLALLKALARLHSDTHPQRSLLMLVRGILRGVPAVSPRLIQALEIELPAQKRLCREQAEALGAALLQFALSAEPTPAKIKMRIKPATLTHPNWQQQVMMPLSLSQVELSRLAQMLQGALSSLDELKETPVYPQLAPHLFEISNVTKKLERWALFLEKFHATEKTRARWIECSPANVLLVNATLDVSSVLQEHFFSKRRTCVLCSATLTSGGSFDFIKRRLGLHAGNERVREGVFSSPFDYASRSLFSVPLDFPDPSSAEFIPACIEALAEMIQLSKGGVFILFTSYDLLEKCYLALKGREELKPYLFLRQGDLPRHLLLETFKQTHRAVLFGADSFWEGVDVPGDALRCVVVVKLPFPVPTDPLQEAQSEVLKEEGINPFTEHFVPQAVIRFKQGCGRLMRQKEDRGCIVCLDNRIVKRFYGNDFLNSLPGSQTYFGKKKEMFEKMRVLYSRTENGA